MEQYSTRKYVIAAIIGVTFFVYFLRLFYLQVLDNSYKVSAENNARRLITQYPARGLIYDRNGNLMVYNQAAYDLMVEPYQISDFDTLELASYLNLSPEALTTGLGKRRTTARFRREPLLKMVSDVEYARLQDKLYKYHGFYFSPRTLRKYSKPVAAHLLGYVGEVDDKFKPADSGYYALGDYVGISGIEKTYEKHLRGEKGVKIYNVDVHGRIMGAYENGDYDQSAVVGKNLTLTIDLALQEYAEWLMHNFRGSVVAIEPATGEVLAMVSAPSYDPALLVGRVRSQNFGLLQRDARIPLFNRALMAKYPPGSTFKLINGLIGLQEKVIFPSTSFYCTYGFHSGRVSVGCHDHRTPLDYYGGVSNSCNAYFCHTYQRILENPKYTNTAEAFNVWRQYVTSFGFGTRLGIDQPNELNGYVPTVAYYDKYYGSGHWRFLTVVSLSIGQGELGITPLQMANMAATMANRGFYFTPHLVKDIEGADDIDPRFKTKHIVPIDTTHFNTSVIGMERAVNGPGGGTAWIANLNHVGIVVCGKTGTAENPHGDDHSIFIAFAPKENPRIAIAVYVENAGFGATYAAPVASLMFEKYLTDTIARPWLEQHLRNAKLKYN